MKTADARRQTFPAPQWWIDAAYSATRMKGSQARLIRDLRVRFGATYDPAEVSRCCSGERVLVVLAQQISSVLGIPQPIYIPVTLEESVRMGQQRELTDRRALAEHRLTLEVDPRVEAVRTELQEEVSVSDTVQVNHALSSTHGSRLSGRSRRVGSARPRVAKG